MMWVVMSVRLQCFPFATPTFCFGSNADRHISWCNIVMMKESHNFHFFFFFVSLGAEHSDVRRYVCPPSMFSLGITHLLLRFEGGHAYIMMQHRDDEREPAIDTSPPFFFCYLEPSCWVDGQDDAGFASGKCWKQRHLGKLHRRL